MSTLKQNISANFLGKGWSLFIGLFSVPFYIRFLGIEAYGLVGFFATLQATVALLDFGLSATMNREMARYSVRLDKSDEARDLTRTLEIAYWVTGLIIGVGVYGAAPWVVTSWIKVGALPANLVQQAIVMMGIIIAFQWPIGLYNGGLMGLERQVLLNGLTAILGTLRSVGAVLILWLVKPTVTFFFSWQIFISIIQVAVFTVFFWRTLPPGSRYARFDLRLLHGVWRFTAGMSATAFVTFFLSQLDKIILSKILTLEMFGYYILANQVNTALRMSSASIFTALLPRFSSLVAKDDGHNLKMLYHQGCQLVSLVVLPASAVVAFFAFQLISIWTHNEIVAQTAAPIASLLVLGSALNSMMGLPYDLTVAYGWVRMGFYQNLISAILLVPAITVLAIRFGGIGAAIVWVILNAGSMLISAPIIHRRILNGELRQWYLVDIGLPFVISFIVAGFGWWVVPNNLPIGQTILAIALISAATLAACAISLPFIRNKLWYMLSLVRARV